MRKQNWENNLGIPAEIFENGDIYVEGSEGKKMFIGTIPKDWDENIKSYEENK